MNGCNPELFSPYILPFYKGEKMDSFEGTTKPIFTNPDEIINKYKTQYELKHAKED